MTRIVSAAVKLKNGRVLMCVRHMDQLFHKSLGLRLGSPEHFALVKGAVQGFVDTDANFLERREAWEVAEAAGQIVKDRDWCVGILHSEHLY